MKFGLSFSQLICSMTASIPSMEVPEMSPIMVSGFIVVISLLLAMECFCLKLWEY